MLENCQKPTKQVISTYDNNKKSIRLTSHERISAGKRHLTMKIRSNSQLSGSHLFDAVTRNYELIINKTSSFLLQ